MNSLVVTSSAVVVPVTGASEVSIVDEVLAGGSGGDVMATGEGDTDVAEGVKLVAVSVMGMVGVEGGGGGGTIIVVVGTGGVKEATELLGVEVGPTSGSDGEEKGARGSMKKEDASN